MSEPVQKSHFHDREHAREFDRRAAHSDTRAELTLKLIEALELKGNETVLDVATGTGRFAQPVSKRLHSGKVVGLDQALAMLGVAREKSVNEAIPNYLQLAGDAGMLPFRAGVFDRVFVAFSLHHFNDPVLAVREARRVLKTGGRLAVLDPVVVRARDALDESIHEIVNRVFGRSHGGVFRFHSAEEIQGFFEREKLKVTRSDVHRVSFDQDGMEGIPTGRHWLEAAEEVERQPADMKKRFEENYFRFWKSGDKTHVKGSFQYALICGEKI
ncbi:MAG TPA: methyltransferase domain-containing protein [Candidatus Binatia bacterium]